MNESSDALTEAVEIFRSCSDPLRLRILHLLRGGEICVGDLVSTLEVPQPTVSRHLGHLRDLGLVAARHSGPWRFYDLSPAEGPFLSRVHACLNALFEQHTLFEADRRRLREVRSGGGCCPDAGVRASEGLASPPSPRCTGS